MSDETFYGYCFPVSGGWYTPAVVLRSAQEVFNYTQLHGKPGMFQEVMITDSGDFTVVQMVDGKYIYPEEWFEFNKEVSADDPDKHRTG